MTFQEEGAPGMECSAPDDSGLPVDAEATAETGTASSKQDVLFIYASNLLLPAAERVDVGEMARKAFSEISEIYSSGLGDQEARFAHCRDVNRR